MHFTLKDLSFSDKFKTIEEHANAISLDHVQSHGDKVKYHGHVYDAVDCKSTTDKTGEGHFTGILTSSGPRFFDEGDFLTGMVGFIRSADDDDD